MKRPKHLYCVLPALLVATASLSLADNWPAWRGEKMDGICKEKNVPTKWSPSENVAWKLPLPGSAGATPIVWKDRIFLTSADGDDLVLMCVSTAGKELWRKTIASGNTRIRVDEANLASPSPVTDGKHVWVFFGTGDLVCCDFDGKEIWRINLQKRYGKFDIQFGMTVTPLLDNGRLYIPIMHGEGDPKTQQAYIVALDAANGKEIWKVTRKTDATRECEHAYTSPILYSDGKQRYLLTHGADYVMGHSLADGSEIWRRGDLHPEGIYNPTLRFVASPSCRPGMIVVPTAKRGKVIALRGDLKGDVTTESKAVLWERSRGTPDVPSPLIVDDLVYLCNEKGILTCVAAKTGETVYQERTVSDRHRASPVYADGNVYLTARNGIVTVVRAGRRFEILAQNDLEQPTTASPVFSEGKLYIRTFETLWCIGK